MFIKIIDAINFILSIPAAIVRFIYYSLVMMYILLFKGRNAFNLYYIDSMNSSPLTLNDRIKWDLIGAMMVYALVIILFL